MIAMLITARFVNGVMLSSSRRNLIGLATSRPTVLGERQAVQYRYATTMSSDSNHFDYLVIGGGSGGIASARRAATYGANVAVIEKGALGGTCVNVGCVPKKVMWNAAHITEMMHDASLYYYSGADGLKLDWAALKTARDNYVKRLNGIYGRNLDNSGVTKIEGLASFESPNAVRVGDDIYTADHVLIAVGGVRRRHLTHKFDFFTGAQRARRS